MQAMMRADLAQDGVAIPAFEDVQEDDQYVGEHYIVSEELQGSVLEGNAEYADDPRYNYTRLRLKDGRLLYFIGIDLDFFEGEGK